MTEEKYVLKYQNELTEELEKYEELKAKAERKIALISQKLKNPARAFQKELKDQSLRAKKILGVPVPPRRSNLPARAAALEDPALEQKPKKSFLSSLFEEDEE